MTMTKGMRRMVFATLLVTLTALLAACGAAQPAAPAPAAEKPAAAAEAPAKAEAPAAPAAPDFDKLIVAADMVRGATNVPQEKRGELVCVQNSRYARNERVVWRIKVMDPRTGDYLGDGELGQVEVKLKDGQVFLAKYGPHGKEPNPVESFWTAGWTIPGDYPSGTTGYTINVVAKDGRTGVNVPDFKVPAAFLTVLDAEVEVLPPPPPKS